MAVLKNRAKMSTSTTGTGTITLGSAESGYQTFADAGVADQDFVRYIIEDTGGAFEIGVGLYTASGTTLSRIVSESSNSDAAINLSGSATVFVGAAAEDLSRLFVLTADTTDATATVLTTNGSTPYSSNQISAKSDTCVTFDGTITAMQNGAQSYASWKIEGLLVNDGGTTTLANSATTVIQNASSWGMVLSADDTNDALAVTVTGEAAHNIRWSASIRANSVTYA